MRRLTGFVGVLLIGATALAMSGCSLPPGTDGDLTNQWPMMAAPTGWEPEAGKCHSAFEVAATRSSYYPVDCTQLHSYETVAVVQFTGNAANLGAPPGAGSPEMKAAWD